MITLSKGGAYLIGGTEVVENRCRLRRITKEQVRG